MRVIFIGDIFGKIGRKAVAQILPEWRKKYAPDFVIGNNENLAHGSGISRKTVQEVFDAGVDALTGGNHTLDKPEGRELLNEQGMPLLRPANLPAGTAGRGELVLVDKKTGALRLLVLNLIGQVFFKEGEKYSNPFRALDGVLERYRISGGSASGGPEAEPRISINGIVIDFHAEATSEKNALGNYADGRVSAVVGTHTHVGTTDARILPGGTAYVTDIGGSVAVDSVIGEKKENIITSFLTDKLDHEPVEKGLCNVGAVLIDIDESTGKARTIKRIDEQIIIEIE